VAVSLAAPAQADSAQDRQYLSELGSAGLTITNPSTAISHAHLVCNEGLGHGVSVQEMRTTMTSWGYSSNDASTVIATAVSVYCPEHSDDVAGAGGGSDSGSSDAGDQFVQQLRRNQNISIDKGAAMDMADTACRAPLAGVGLYNAWQVMQQRYPKYSLNTVASVMSKGVVIFCPQRLP
jgi:hypothetical protein